MVVTNFKPRRTPHKKKRERKREKRPGMSAEHLELIRQLPSCLSGKKPCDPHHLRVSNERGVGLKATDRWAIPLTRDEHTECHLVGSRKEEDWFLARGIDCYSLANALWQNTGNLKVMENIVATHLRDARNK